MNQHTLTRTEAARLFRLIAYGRGTAALMSRALDLDRRTCKRLTSTEGLCGVVAMIDARRLELREWYALLYADWHSWGGGYYSTSGWHQEACTARDLRDELASVAVERIGGIMLERMVEAWSRDRGTRAPSPQELRKTLERDPFEIPEPVERFYHLPEPDPASFTGADGNPLQP